MKKRYSRNTLLIIFLLTLGLSTQVAAASPYELKTSNEILYLGGGAALSLAGLYAEKDRKAPTESDLANLNKSDVLRLEQRYTGRWNESSSRLSDITLAAGILSPLSLLLIDNTSKSDFTTIGVMYLETYMLSNGGVIFSKGTVSRYRPLAYGDNASLAERARLDTKRSFFSGHAALSASGFIFSATVFSDYFPNSKYKSAVWAAAITGTATTGLLRIKAGKHYPTDVIAGWVWGGVVGYLIPKLHKKKSHSKKQSFTFMPFSSVEQQGLLLTKRF